MRNAASGDRVATCDAKSFARSCISCIRCHHTVKSLRKTHYVKRCNGNTVWPRSVDLHTPKQVCCCTCVCVFVCVCVHAVQCCASECECTRCWLVAWLFGKHRNTHRIRHDCSANGGDNTNSARAVQQVRALCCPPTHTAWRRQLRARPHAPSHNCKVAKSLKSTEFQTFELDKF
jgi:hypothetical protein